jgi:hypothetical protein
VHDHTITFMLVSSLRAISLARAYGLPSKTHSCGNGAASSSTSEGLAVTMCCAI